MIIDEDDYMNFIEHHGVKGQKWGVRNIRERLGTDVQKLLHDHPNPPLSPGQKKILDANNKKWKAKFEGPKGWTPGEKHAAEVAAGVAFVGALTIATKGKDLKKAALLRKGFSVEDYAKFAKSADTPEWLGPLRGKEMSGTDYRGLVDHTKGRLWTADGYVTKDSFQRPPMTFPKGHQFYRLSNRAEDSYGIKTYSIASKDDLARYRTSYLEGGYQIGFKATGDVKVPDLHTNLEAMRKAMIQSGNRGISPKSVMEMYNNKSGGLWDGEVTMNFFRNLSQQGYHAVVDEMDAGIYGETPLVFFDHSTLGAKTATKLPSLTAEQKKTYMVKELANRR